jgi:hypothetical protein
MKLWERNTNNKQIEHHRWERQRSDLVLAKYDAIGSIMQNA